MIATFYSFKGGVGRSMAVANVADILARQGLRVLAIDFDLEAPGLEQYFQIDHRSARRAPGLLDLLLSYKQWMSVTALATEEPAFRKLDQFILPIYPKLPGNGCLDLLHAGRRAPKEEMDRYASELRSFDWQDFYFNWDGELFFEYLRSSLAPPKYDLVIVDSRTGVTEMGGICTYQLADIIVLFTAANHQNRLGTLDVVRDFESLPLKVARSDRPLQMLIVPARVEQCDQALLETFLREFDGQFGDRFPRRLREKGITCKDLLIPYEPAYAFEERVLSDPARAQERKAIAGAFVRLAEAVRLLTSKESEADATAARAPGDAMATPAPAAAAYDAARRFASYDVFLSSSTTDEESVAPLVTELQRRGAKVFTDRRDVVVGTDWRARTEHALFHSELCLIAFGPSALPARHIEELSVAVEGSVASHGLRVLPVLLPGADLDRVLASLPQTLARTMPLDLRAGVDATASQSALDTLCALSAQPQPAAAPTRSTSPGDERSPASARAATIVAASPYPGNRPFTEADAGFLFGRADSIAEIVRRLDSHKLVVVTGPSACGKTSLIHAGVAPALRGRGTSPDDSFTMIAFVPDEHPLRALETAFESLERVSGRAFFVIDQLERVLRRVSEADIRAFLTRVQQFVSTSDTRVILIARDVRLRHLRKFAPDGLLDETNVVRLPALGNTELRAIIERPAERAGLAFEPGLVQRLLTDWGQDQRFLPFLQIVLHELWLQRREGFLTNRAYDACPDPVEELAEQAYQAMPQSMQQCAERVIPRLLTICGNLVPIGLSCRKEELEVSGITEKQLSALIWYMVDRSLLYGFADDTGDGRLAPSFAAEEWSRAERWIEKDAKFYAWLDTFNQRRLESERGGRHTDTLLRGPLLDDALAQTKFRGADLTAEEIAFVEQSSLQSARRQRRRQLVIAQIVFAVIATVGLSILNFSGRRTRDLESVSDARVLLRLSQELAAANEVEQARRGFERASQLYAAAGNEAEAQTVRLYKTANELQHGSRAAAEKEFAGVLAWASTQRQWTFPSSFTEELSNASRLFYTQGDADSAANGLMTVWRSNNRRPRTPDDLTGHRLSLALAGTRDYRGARIVFREAWEGSGSDSRGPTSRRVGDVRPAVIDFYERTIIDAPLTTQAYENLTLLLLAQARVWEAVQVIDRGIAVAQDRDVPILDNLKATRRDLLKSVTPSERSSSPPLGRYICEHNFQVYVMSVAPPMSDRALATVRARLPLAEAGPPDNGAVPIIGDFFLTCEQARLFVEKESGQGQGPFVGAWYPGCPTCPRFPGRDNQK